MTIDTLEALRRLYPPPRENAVRKQLASLDTHCRSFIALSPLCVLATADASGRMDASPRGGRPGFVHVASASVLLIADAPGNNRLDSLENIVQTGRAGLLFLIPGVDETLRVNGRAELSQAPEDIAAAADDRRTPKLVIKLAVQEAYLHCAKALMRSRLWAVDAQVPRSVLPTTSRMIMDQIGVDGPAETHEEMVRRYQSDL